MATNLQGTAGAWAASSARTASGETQLIANNGATFYLTGVQLELGDTATPFEHRSYGDELAKCQRYYQRLDSSTVNSTEFAIGVAYHGSYAVAPIPLRPFMRAAPSASSSGTFQFAGASGNVVTAIVFSSACESSIRFRGYSANSFTAHGGYRLRDGGSGDAVLKFDAEL